MLLVAKTLFGVRMRETPAVAAHGLAWYETYRDPRVNQPATVEAPVRRAGAPRPARVADCASRIWRSVGFVR